MASSSVPSMTLGALPKEFDFDSLPYIDGEVDAAMMNRVQNMIAQEMRTFKPKNYLKEGLPMPELRFANSDVLRKEYERVSNGMTMEKMDMSRYAVEPPPKAMENDVQAWRKAVANAKSQIEHSSNRLLNLELTEKNNSAVWLHYNKAVEGLTRGVDAATNAVKRKTDDVNISRRVHQEKEYTKIAKLVNKRQEALVTAWQIKSQL